MDTLAVSPAFSNPCEQESWSLPHLVVPVVHYSYALGPDGDAELSVECPGN